MSSVTIMKTVALVYPLIYLYLHGKAAEKLIDTTYFDKLAFRFYVVAMITFIVLAITNAEFLLECK